MNETQLCYGNIFDKTVNFKSKSKHANSKSQTNNKEYGTVVKQDEFSKPENDEVEYIHNDTFQDRRKKCFLFHLIIDVNMILNLQIWKTTNKFFQRKLSCKRNSILNSMD